jgi:hypothetical protein
MELMGFIIGGVQLWKRYNRKSYGPSEFVTEKLLLCCITAQLDVDLSFKHGRVNFTSVPIF